MNNPSPVVLITGALTGIGRATALAFAREGASVVVSGRRDPAGRLLAWSRPAAAGTGPGAGPGPDATRAAGAAAGKGAAAAGAVGATSGAGAAGAAVTAGAGWGVVDLK